MRFAPVRFLAERRKQTITGKFADNAKARPRNFAKARLIAQFGDKIGMCYENADTTAEL